MALAGMFNADEQDGMQADVKRQIGVVCPRVFFPVPEERLRRPNSRLYERFAKQRMLCGDQGLLNSNGQPLDVEEFNSEKRYVLSDLTDSFEPDR